MPFDLNSLPAYFNKLFLRMDPPSDFYRCRQCKYRLFDQPVHG